MSLGTTALEHLQERLVEVGDLPVTGLELAHMIGEALAETRGNL
jgi:hypothetical protein